MWVFFFLNKINDLICKENNLSAYNQCDATCRDLLVFSLRQVRGSLRGPELGCDRPTVPAAQSPSARPPTGDACFGRAV